MSTQALCAPRSKDKIIIGWLKISLAGFVLVRYSISLGGRFRSQRMSPADAFRGSNVARDPGIAQLGGDFEVWIVNASCSKVFL